MTESVPPTEEVDRPTGLRQIQREQTIELIINAFSELVFVNPRFTMQELADAAGISVRTLYRYFANRDELTTGMLAAVNQRIDPEHIAGIGIMDEGNEARIRTNFRIFGEHDHLMRAVVTARLSGAMEDPDHQRRNRQIIEGTNRRLADRPDVLKRQLAGLVRLIGGSVSWMTLTDGSIELTTDEASDAVVWAVQVLADAAVDAGDRLQ